MPTRKTSSERTKSTLPGAECEALVEAARGVVRAHDLRDRDEADDSDVSDAISELEDSLPRRTRRARRR